MNSMASMVSLPRDFTSHQRLQNRMADLVGILARIDLANAERGDDALNDTQLSLAATEGRSTDLIRNWRRAVKAGKTASARLVSITSVADVLGVTEQWLATGELETPVITPLEQELLAEFRAVPKSAKARTLEAALATIRLGRGEDPEVPEEDAAAPQRLKKG